MPDFKVTILGSGTSMGVPTLTCRCPVCLSPNPKDKRLRAGAWIQVRGRSVLIDCSIDFRQQALANGIEDVDDVLITHAHADHISGIDDLRIYNQVHRKAIDFYGAAHVLDEVARRFHYCFNPTQVGGGVPQIRLRPVEAPFALHGLEVTPVPVKHGVLDIYGYRIGGLGYVTDGSHLPPESEALLEGVDTLVINALKREPHSTHFSLYQALEVVERLQPRRAWFVHMCHFLGHDETNEELPPHVQLAYDGLTFDIAAD